MRIKEDILKETAPEYGYKSVGDLVTQANIGVVMMFVETCMDKFLAENNGKITEEIAEIKGMIRELQPNTERGNLVWGGENVKWEPNPDGSFTMQKIDEHCACTNPKVKYVHNHPICVTCNRQVEPTNET